MVPRPSYCSAATLCRPRYPGASCRGEQPRRPVFPLCSAWIRLPEQILVAEPPLAVAPPSPASKPRPEHPAEFAALRSCSPSNPDSKRAPGGRIGQRRRAPPPCAFTAGSQRRRPNSLSRSQPSDGDPAVQIQSILGRFAKKPLSFVEIKPQSAAVQMYLQNSPFSFVLAPVLL